MSKAFGIELQGLDEMVRNLEKLGANANQIADEMLIKTHEIVTAKAASAVGHLPAGGKYSTGKTAASLKVAPKITWSGTTASVEVGFSIKKGGLPSIFMMYGTPRYMKVQEMYDAFYSEQTKDEIFLAQKEIYDKALAALGVE